MVRQVSQGLLHVLQLQEGIASLGPLGPAIILKSPEPHRWGYPGHCPPTRLSNWCWD